MTTLPLHIVQKQVVNITLPDIGAALAWSTDGHQAFVKLLSEQLERSLSEFDMNDHLIIDTMALDLGSFTPGLLHAELPARFHAALREALEAYRPGRSTQTSSDQKNRGLSQNNFENDRPHTKEGNAENQTAEDKTNHRVYDARKGRLASLLFFLRKGYLPWWGSGLAAWDEAWLEELTLAEVKELKDFFVAADLVPRSRMITQFPDAFIDRLLWRTTRQVEIIDTWVWLKHVVENLKEAPLRLSQNDGMQAASFVERLLTSPPVKIAALRHRYWMAWMAYAWNESAIPTLESVLVDHREYFFLIRQLLQDKTLTTLRNVLVGEQIPVSWRAALEREISSNEDRYAIGGREIHNPEPNRNQKSSSGTIADTTPEEKPEVLSPRTKPDVAQHKTKVPDESPDTLWVNEAGVILLYPFLAQLFRSRGWVEKENFVDAAGQTMAIFALHYLATGETEAPEHKLLVPKWMTGMPLETALQPVDPLTADDQAACDELLSEVIRHWSALRNTSPDGLRQAYLQRDGKLESHDGRWRLVVEHKAQDILLSRLPWGLSIIKFPWINELLSVTWQ
jgi:hypothetical protein